MLPKFKDPYVNLFIAFVCLVIGYWLFRDAMYDLFVRGE